MKYIRLLDNTICSIYDIRRENPNVSLPMDADCSFLGYDFLIETPAPNPLPWCRVAEDVPVNNTQTWKQEPQNEIEVVRLCTREIQKYLDEFAQTRGYDSIMSATTYAASTNTKFSAEGQYCVSARDEVWAAAYTLLDDVKTGRLPMPALEDIFVMLPALVWPN